MKAQIENTLYAILPRIDIAFDGNGVYIHFMEDSAKRAILATYIQDNDNVLDCWLEDCLPDLREMFLLKCIDVNIDFRFDDLVREIAESEYMECLRECLSEVEIANILEGHPKYDELHEQWLRDSEELRKEREFDRNRLP